MEFLDAINSEWSSMWQFLAQDPINKGDPLCLNNGLAWQYMGSTSDHHYFKHEYHPLTHQIEYIYIERRCPGVNWEHDHSASM